MDGYRPRNHCSPMVARLLTAPKSLHRCALQLVGGALVQPARGCAPVALRSWRQQLRAHLSPGAARCVRHCWSLWMVARCVPLIIDTWGKAPPSNRPLAVIWGTVSSSCGEYAKPCGAMRRECLADLAVGNLRGENWKPEGWFADLFGTPPDRRRPPYRGLPS